MPSKYEAAFQAAVIDRERQICIDLLRETPELTLGEIHKLSKGSLGRIFDAISVAEIIAGEAAGEADAAPVKVKTRGKAKTKAKSKAKAKAGRPRGRPRGRPPGRKSAKAAPQQSLIVDAEPESADVVIDVDDRSDAPKKVNTRTPAGRDAYDRAIFQALTDVGQPVGVAKLMAAAGGTNLQARAALNRLIDAGKVSWTGKARGTRYSVT